MLLRSTHQSVLILSMLAPRMTRSSGWQPWGRQFTTCYWKRRSALRVLINPLVSGLDWIEFKSKQWNYMISLMLYKKYLWSSLVVYWLNMSKWYQELFYFITKHNRTNTNTIPLGSCKRLGLYYRVSGVFIFFNLLKSSEEVLINMVLPCNNIIFLCINKYHISCINVICSNVCGCSYWLI